MRASQYFLPTTREKPAEAEIASHQLMLRAGMIRKLGSGLYTWLPLGLRVLHKVEAIVREEMGKVSALEVLMPAVQPAELWQETGRWDLFGSQLLTMQDNAGRAYCFGPTHEEVITDLIRQQIQSYKALPLTFYQIQTKFRDEIRPRFGLMRAREFIMKDGYSFHLDMASLQDSYEKMREAYCQIFDRLGLTYRVVEADTGAIGGSHSHEFQVLADSGEDLIFYSDASDYAANVEKATSLTPQSSSLEALRAQAKDKVALQVVSTPEQKSIEDLVCFFKTEAAKVLKTLIVEGSETPLVALVLRGDDELNLIKAAKHPLIKAPLTLACEEKVKEALELPFGFIGPVGLSIPIIADHAALVGDSFICGANQEGEHYQFMAWGRDAQYQALADLRTVKEGDPSPDGKGQLKACRGIEVGHIFQLGDKYTKAMNAKVINETGQLQTLIMGTYGLGISRVVAAAIEQQHDERGIIWPQSMAPFQVVIIPINAHRSVAVQEAAEALYQDLTKAGIEVLLDDRKERPGVLFADSDLIGIPHRVVLSEKYLEKDELEYKARAEETASIMPLKAFKPWLLEQLIRD